MYDESKRFAEAATQSYISTHNLHGSMQEFLIHTVLGWHLMTKGCNKLYSPST